MKIIPVTDIRRGDTIYIGGVTVHVADVAIGETMVAIRTVPDDKLRTWLIDPAGGIHTVREVVLINRPLMPSVTDQWLTGPGRVFSREKTV